MAGGFRDWIPDSPEVIARVKAESAKKKSARKAAIKKLKKVEPVVVAQAEPAVVEPKKSTEPTFGPEDLSRDALLEVARKQGIQVQGNVSKDTLISRLRAKALTK